MKVQKLLEKIAWQENELYNLYKLGETFAVHETPQLAEHFNWLASEELRHRNTVQTFIKEKTLENSAVIDHLDALSLEPYLTDERVEPEDLEDLILEALIREKHSYELYQKLSEILKGSLSQIFRMMSQEELKHAYRLKIIYEAVHK
ncbi:ferritin family protein [Thermococcus sp. SY098]|uniref:ferritin family protein n=1 Tax=Thermococcus sp. SY098 TaxID=3111325 RepID=UPI002D79DB42|nr:ferritin family protein [Thermococcus sp. SY098]WRS52176.1 ferritin family protein [Thermococcus sp. SY098]